MTICGTPAVLASVALLRRHYVDMPEWITWMWVAFALIAFVSALVGWWRSTRPRDHGSEALARLRKAQSTRRR